MTREVLNALYSAGREAAVPDHPNEVCGILLGAHGSQGANGARGSRVLAYKAAKNVHPTPETHFEIDPQALISAHRAARGPGGGHQVLGYFHSHPSGPARPSVTDAALAAADGSIWAIFGTVHGSDEGHCGVRFFRAPLADGEGGFAELSMSVIES